MPREDWPPEGDSLKRAGARYYTSTEACSCPDWTWRGSRPGKHHGRPCKHITALRRAVSLLAQNSVKWSEREATGQHSENNLI